MSSTEPQALRPPEDLEERVVARLRDAGLIEPARTTQETSMKAIHLRWGLAATVLLAAGVFAGTQMPRTAGDNALVATGEPAAAPDPRPAFALMLYEDANYQAPAGETEHTARVAEYATWARKLAGEGRLVDGAELVGGGVLLHRDRPRSEGVPTSAEGQLAGYFVIRAATLEEAERIAAECPHLTYGGTVSVRPTGA